MERLKIVWVCRLIRTLGKTEQRDEGQGNENSGANRGAGKGDEEREEGPIDNRSAPRGLDRQADETRM